MGEGIGESNKEVVNYIFADTMYCFSFFSETCILTKSYLKQSYPAPLLGSIKLTFALFFYFTAVRRPNRMRLPSELYYYSGECPDNATLLEIKENFLVILSSVNKLYNRICPNNFTCTVDKVSVDCGPVLARTRRDVKLAMQQDGQLKHNHHVNKREESHAVVFRFDIVTTFGDENDTFDDAYDATESLQELQREEFSRLIQNGTFDIEGLLLRPDSFQPAEYADLACEPGTILYDTTCSKPRSIFCLACEAEARHMYCFSVVGGVNFSVFRSFSRKLLGLEP